jgi:hypothetical protein
MTGEPLLAPQLVVGSRMLHFGWIPADPDAAAALVPGGLTPAANRGIYLNQYVVDTPEQTSGFGAYSLTYLGVELEGLDAPGGGAGRFWTHYFNSSDAMRGYARERGVPATPGETVIEIEGSRLVATSFSNGKPVIRSEARLGSGTSESASGHLRYVTRVGEGFVSGRYAFTAGLTDGFELVSCEFLDPDHDVYALRPADPLELTFGFYSPNASFCYPGGEEPVP